MKRHCTLLKVREVHAACSVSASQLRVTALQILKPFPRGETKNWIEIKLKAVSGTRVRGMAKLQSNKKARIEGIS